MENESREKILNAIKTATKVYKELAKDYWPYLCMYTAVEMYPDLRSRKAAEAYIRKLIDDHSQYLLYKKLEKITNKTNELHFRMNLLELEKDS